MGQAALLSHLRQAGEFSFPTLQAPLSAVPLKCVSEASGDVVWQGQEQSEAQLALRQRLPFRVDDLLLRTYRHRSGTSARLYMVYSRAGEDRQHHPEICIRDVRGAPEDVAFRQQVPLEPSGEAQATRFRFWTGAGRFLVVYYWHYTLEPQATGGQSRLQAFHQRLGISSPSVTVQVSLPADEPTVLAEAESVLLPALHAAMRQRVLPPTSRCGCDRLPIGLAR